VVFSEKIFLDKPIERQHPMIQIAFSKKEKQEAKKTD
jgi:hypothetical protein